MAKESMKAREVKRRKLAQKYAKKREELLAKGDYMAIQLIPRNASPVRQRNRCSITGRPRGYIREFGVCRNVLREMVSFGLIPGLKKASW